MQGEYLTKCNLNSNGRKKKFIKLMNDNTIRLAANDKDIKKLKKFETCTKLFNK